MPPTQNKPIEQTSHLDLRCMCSQCENRTKETYQLTVRCHNCGYSGKALLRKGDKPSLAKECPNCGCSYTLTFGHDPGVAGGPLTERFQ